MKLISLALTIGLFVLVGYGQDSLATPDLSGTWEYVAANSPFKYRVLVTGASIGNRMTFGEAEKELEWLHSWRITRNPSCRLFAE